MENQRIKALEEFVREDPDDLFSLYALALEYLKEDDEAKALSQMEFVLQKDENYLPVYYQLGRLYEKTDKQRAAEVYQRGMEIAVATGKRHTYNELRGALEDVEE